jgi:tRNA (cmo5U34)-methyltransferase
LSNPSDPHGHHDWHSRSYVDDWIARDVTRDAVRAPQLAAVARRVPAGDAPVRVLDVGGGYGMLTAAVLDELPQATVVLHDFSEPMLAHAAERLAQFGDRVTYARADLRDRGWTAAVGDGFDAVVSAIAIHNVRDHAVMRQVFADVRTVLRPGGVFLDHDLVWGGAPAPGSLADQLGWLVDAGFVDVDCAWREPPLALLTAQRPGA